MTRHATRSTAPSALVFPLALLPRSQGCDPTLIDSDGDGLGYDEEVNSVSDADQQRFRRQRVS